MSSRPTRPGSFSSDSQPKPAVVAGASEQSFEDLRMRHEALVRQRGRLELLHEQAGAEVQACMAEAARLGVGSLEELGALIVQSEAEDRKALEAFQAGIQAEEELQQRVMSELAAIGE